MASVASLSASLQQRVRAALAAAVPSAADADPLLRRSDRADFQANGVLGLAKRAKANPRELAATVLAALPADDLIGAVEVSGPGFLNITVPDSAITANLAARAADDRLGVPVQADPGITVIDYAQPNVAKEMHVGHLRSSVIGDAIARILRVHRRAGDPAAPHRRLGHPVRHAHPVPDRAPARAGRARRTRTARRRCPASTGSTRRPGRSSTPTRSSRPARAAGWCSSRPATRRRRRSGSATWTSRRSTSTRSTTSWTSRSWTRTSSASRTTTTCWWRPASCWRSPASRCAPRARCACSSTTSRARTASRSR